MRWIHRTLILLTAMLSLSSAQAKLRVVTTTQDAGAITRAIGGDRVDVLSLCKGYQDPHFLDPKPSYMLKLNRADLFEVIGLELEIGYSGPLLTGARNQKIMPGQPGYLDLSAAISPLEVKAVADRGEGDVHPLGNPHYWLDPENGRLMARQIAKRLSELDPKGSETFAQNLAAFEKTLSEKEAVWAERLKPLAGKSIVTYHLSWSYLLARYGLKVVAFVEPKPGIPPTPRHMLEVIKIIKRTGAKVLLMENFYDERVPKLIASHTGIGLAVVPNSVKGEKDVVTYFDLLDRITNTIEKALEGK